jgi:tetratricopeptide (TPR) repeat protein
VVQHITRKELKKDQVQEALAHSAEAVLSHQKTLIYVVIAALLVGGGIFGWRFYTQRESAKANAAFGSAMEVFQAPILALGTAPQPDQIAYNDPAKKFQDALKKFEDVAKDYPRTHSGELSRYYAALSLENLHQDEKAIAWLNQLQNSTNPDFAAMARFELAQIYDRSNHPDQAVTLYNEILNNPSPLVPKPIVLLALAEHFRQSNPAQAAKYYNQIKAEYPDTGVADEADQALALLPTGKS